MKRRSIFLIVFLIIVILLIGSRFYQQFIRIQNVFDQMYYTRVHERFDWWNPGNFRGLFENMEQLENAGRDTEQSSTWEGYFFEQYRPEFLEEGTSLKIDFFMEPKEILIEYDTNDGEKFYIYRYYVQNRTLLYESNDPDNTDKEFLYEIFLKDWFEANPGTRFSIDRMGNLKIAKN